MMKKFIQTTFWLMIAFIGPLQSIPTEGNHWIVSLATGLFFGGAVVAIARTYHK